MRAVTLAVCLAGCGAIEAHQARTKLLGMSEADLTSCAGPATRRADIAENEHVLEIQYAGQETSVASIKLLDDLSFALGATGGCHALFRMRDGRVVAVHYEGSSMSFSGTSSACAPIVRDCLP